MEALELDCLQDLLQSLQILGWLIDASYLELLLDLAMERS